MTNPLAALPRPYPPLAWRTARNSAILWVLLHLAAAVFLGWSLPSVATGVILVAFTGALIHFDARRFHEQLFHANLGVPAAWDAGIALAVGGALELLAQLLLR